MNDGKPDHLTPVPPSLRAAIQRARVESAEQGQAVVDLREAEVARLDLLLDALRPVLDQAPEGVDLFDPSVAHRERPRLFLDMISFIDLGHDRRTYRFFLDTRHGRVLIAESPSIERIVAAVTNYVARRLVERERALASDWRNCASPTDKPAATRAAPPVAAARTGVAASSPARRGWIAAIAEAFNFLLLTLGSIAFVALVCLGAYVAWNAWGRAWWTARFGAPPI